MSNIIVSKLDANQVLRQSYDDSAEALKVLGVGGTLVPEKYDKIELTYVAAGVAAGEVETVTYSLDSTDIATLTLGYNGSGQLTTVTRT